MKKKSLLVLCLAVVAAACIFLVNACSGGVKPYVNALPEDATVLVELKPMQLMKKLGYTEQDMPAHELIEKTGLDIDNPAYVFVQSANRSGAVAKLKDAEKFDQYVTERVRTIKKEGNYKYSLIESGVCVAWDNARVLALATPDSEIPETVKTLMEKDTAPEAMIAKLNAYQESVVAYVSGQQLGEVQELQSCLSMLPLDLSKFDLVATLDAEAKQVCLGLHVLTEDSEAQAQLSELSEYANCVSGDALLQFGDDIDVCAGYNFNGPKLLEKITEKVPEVALLLPVIGDQFGIDLSNLFDSVVGDFTFAANNIKSFNPNVYAELQVNVASILPINFSQYGINIETKGDKVVLTYGDDMLGDAPAPSMVELRDKVRGSYGYIYINPSLIMGDNQMIARLVGCRSLLVRFDTPTDVTVTLDLDNNIRDIINLASRFVNL